MTAYEVWLSFGVLIFGLLVMAIELYLMKVNKFDQNQTIKFLLVTLIITAALFLIAAGFSNNQIAPAMGLLGTVAGYLLGKGDSSVTNDSSQEMMNTQNPSFLSVVGYSVHLHVTIPDDQ